MIKETIYVEADNDAGYRLINKDEFDSKTMKEYTGPLRGLTPEELRNRNSSGTFSEPTPTDIRYPNLRDTEFENNYGAFVGSSAAELREKEGIEQRPGGLNPAVHEAVQDAAKGSTLAQDLASGRASAPPAPKATDASKAAADEASKTSATEPTPPKPVQTPTEKPADAKK